VLLFIQRFFGEFPKKNSFDFEKYNALNQSRLLSIPLI
jgi:hypothetical protein